MLPRFRLFACACAVGALCANTALAQTATPSTVTDTTTVAQQRVTVEGHYDNAIGTTDAASQGTIRAELLKSRPPQRPG